MERTQTTQKQTEPMEQRPCWKDETRIAAAWRLASANCKHLNSVVLPLCEYCGLPITEEQARGYIGDMEAVEADYINKVLEQTSGVTDFLVSAIEQEARQRFAGFIDSLAGAIKRNPAKEKESYYKLGAQEVTRSEVLETIKLEGNYFRVDYAAIEALYIHYLTEVETAKYERQKAACKALNDLFRGAADMYALQSALIIVGGEFVPNTAVNYNIIK